MDHVIKHMALEKLQAYSFSLPSAEMSASQVLYFVLAVLPTPLVITLVSSSQKKSEKKQKTHSLHFVLSTDKVIFGPSM